MHEYTHNFGIKLVDPLNMLNTYFTYTLKVILRKYVEYMYSFVIKPYHDFDNETRMFEMWVFTQNILIIALCQKHKF